MATDHVLIAGAGFGGLDVAIRVARTRPGTSVTLINPSEYLTYRPWLIYLPAGARRLDDLRVPLAGAARRFGFTLRVDSVKALDPNGKAELVSGEQIHFTHSVVATGARSDPGVFPGGVEHAHTPCDLDGAVRFGDAFRQLEKGQVTIVIGGERPGPGLEYAGWLVRALERKTDRRKIKIQVVDNDGSLATLLGPKALSRVADHFVGRGHPFITDGTVAEIGEDEVRLADGLTLGSDLTAVIGPLAANDIGLPSDAIDERGFVKVDRHLRSSSHPVLFAVGDAAGLPDGLYLPKSMIMARRQARVVADNLVHALDGTELKPFDFESAKKLTLAMPDFGGRTVVVRNQRLITSGRLPLLLRAVIDRSFFRTHNYER